MNKKFGLIACAAALQLLHAGSQAAVVISIQEVGLDVVATGTGTLNLAGLNFLGGSLPISPFIIPSAAFVVVGPAGIFDDYQGSLSGPSSFGSGGSTTAVLGSGASLGIDAVGSMIVVPAGYVTNSPLLGTATFFGASLSSLGATPGTYVYTFGSGLTADSFTVQIGPVAAVPEPSSVAMTLAGIAFVAGVGARRRSGRKASSQGIS